MFEKIFLDLQQDEVELANANFKTLFYLLIQHFQVEGQIAIDKLIPTLNGELSSLVSNILMNEDQYQLHDWEKKNIFVKSRDSQVPQLVNETILTLRKLLIDKKIEEQKIKSCNLVTKDLREFHRQELAAFYAGFAHVVFCKSPELLFVYRCHFQKCCSHVSWPIPIRCM